MLYCKYVRLKSFSLRFLLLPNCPLFKLSLVVGIFKDLLDFYLVGSRGGFRVEKFFKLCFLAEDALFI